MRSQKPFSATIIRIVREVGQNITLSALHYIYARATMSDVEQFARTVVGY